MPYAGDPVLMCNCNSVAEQTPLFSGGGVPPKSPLPRLALAAIGVLLAFLLVSVQRPTEFHTTSRAPLTPKAVSLLAATRSSGKDSEGSNLPEVSEVAERAPMDPVRRLGSVSTAALLSMAALNGPVWADDSSLSVVQPTSMSAEANTAGVEATLGVKIQKAPALTAPALDMFAAPAQTEEPLAVQLAAQGEAFCAPASFAALFLTMLVYWIQAAYYPKSDGLRKAGYSGMLASNLLTAALLSCRWVTSGHFPLSNLYESLMFLSWGVSTVPLALERQVAYGVSTGAIFAPMVLLINAFATLILPPELQRASALVPALKSNWLMMHVSIMMMSYAVLLAGSVMAMAYLFVSRNENGSPQKTLMAASGDVPPPTEAVPDMEAVDGLVMTLDGATVQGQQRTLAETLDDLSYRTLVFGFPLLTIGIISGAVWANEAWGSYWSWDPKETWALITWLVYSFYLHTRLNQGWKGKTSAWVAASGFFVVWVCYIGVNLFGVGLHSYGFFAK
eukprot:EG_transcript_10248